MKKLILVVVFIFCMTGCEFGGDDSDSTNDPSPATTQVRFSNESINIVVLYGIKLGNAQFIGRYEVGDITGYKSINAGDYPVELRSEAGQWFTDTAGTFHVADGNSYRLTIEGDLYGVYFYSLY